MPLGGTGWHITKCGTICVEKVSLKALVVLQTVAVQKLGFSSSNGWMNSVHALVTQKYLRVASLSPCFDEEVV